MKTLIVLLAQLHGTADLGNTIFPHFIQKTEKAQWDVF